MLEGERDRVRAQLTSEIEDLRCRLDEETNERSQLTAMLTEQRLQKRGGLHLLAVR